MILEKNIVTPAFVIDDACLAAALKTCLSLTRDAGCKILYSPKALAISHVIQRLSASVDGFSCSSINEARLVRRVAHRHKAIHLVTPGISATQIEDIAELCDFTVLNSLSHWELYSRALAEHVSVGLRVNPGLSFVDDDRYDPCRPHSKLGVPLEELAGFFKRSPHHAKRLQGLHFHNNCDSNSARQLALTLDRLIERLPDLFSIVRWVNLGGGYLLQDLQDPTTFSEVVGTLRRRFGVEVFVEPGAALVRRAGSIVSRVVDLFESDGAMVAVLDTTVNHMPEVLEYEFTPAVLHAREGGNHAYKLAGCTCLAGDQFGDVSFDQPLSIGSFVEFVDCGAYTFSRANTFNGVGLPSIYRRAEDGEISLIRRFQFEDFAFRAGGASDVCL
jgi:carboxynorspermidine decarboxylase